MKTICKTLATTRTILLAIFAIQHLFTAHAAPRPLVWRADFPSAKVENFPVRHGTDVEFRPSWYVNGSPADTNGWTYSLSVQTNGAPAGEWSVIPGTVFSHTNDCGADAYNVLVRAVDADGTVDYSAAARLRMLPSPGFEPGALPPAATFQESDPVFAAWLSTFEFPETSLEPSTNYTDRAIESFARTNEVLSSGPYLSAVTGGVVRAASPVDDVSIDLVKPGIPMLFMPETRTRVRPGEIRIKGVVWSLVIRPDGFVIDPGGGLATSTFWLPGVEAGEYTLALRSDIPSTNGFLSAETDPTVPDWAKEPDKPEYTPSEIGAAPASITNEMAEMRAENKLVYRLYQGSNIVAEVTNFNSKAHAPELRLMQLNESNEYITVWTETNGLSRTLRAATNYADRAIADHAAPRAWSKVTAGMGVEAPSNTTWLSTARTVIAGGLEFEKHMTTGGAIWLLESNGMTADFHAQTNNTAFLDLSNADGTPIFRVEKTDSFLVGVHVDAVTVDGNALVCQVGVVASEHPLVRVRATLAEGDWAKEEDGIPASLATVTWSGSVGNWACRIQNNTGGGSIFVQMEYLQEGGTKIVNSAPMDVSNGIICTDGQHKVRPVYTNGTITWEVVQ